MSEKEPIPPDVYYFWAEDNFYIMGSISMFNYFDSENETFRERWIGRKDEFPIYKITKKEIV